MRVASVRSAVPAFAILALSAGAALASSTYASHPASARAAIEDRRVPVFSHVFVIIGENTSAGQITPAHAPYLTGTLKPRSAWLTNYHSLGHTSSTGDYIGLTSGQFIHCEAEDVVPSHACHQSVPSIFSQLDQRRIPWQTWAESMDNPCDIFEHGSDWARNVYSSHHNPPLYYTNIEGGRYNELNRPSAECRRNVLPMGTTAPNDTSGFDQALAAGSVARFDLIVPNGCEQGHDACGTNDPVEQFDDFLEREVPKIEASPAFDSRSAIFITWDEGGDPPYQPHHPLALIAGPLVAPGTYAGHFNHYGMLRTLEDGFGLKHLGRARHSAPIGGVWR